MTEVIMPRLDPGMQSGKIVEWLKKEGDIVQKGEPVVVVEGEKTTFEIEAPDSGVLTKILSQPGTDVQVAQAVGIIGDDRGEPRPTQTPPTTESNVPTSGISEKAVASSVDRVIATPVARRLALEHGVDLSRLKGSGPGGRISREDVLASIEQIPSPAQVTQTKARQPAILRTFKLEGVRKVVAERLGFSARTVVPVTLTAEVDASKLVSLKDETGNISFTAFVVKAVAKALEKHPALNSSIEGEEVTIYSDINVSVAINTEQGLVAPLIEGANHKPLTAIAQRIEELAQKAKDNRLSIDELVGGTFTITNLGAYDVESFAPVINPPQCAILGLGRVTYKPVAAGAEITSKPLTILTLVFDHRIVDGVPAAKFLQDVKRNLEEADSLL